MKTFTQILDKNTLSQTLARMLEIDADCWESCRKFKN